MENFSRKDGSENGIVNENFVELPTVKGENFSEVSQALTSVEQNLCDVEKVIREVDAEISALPDLFVKDLDNISSNSSSKNSEEIKLECRQLGEKFQSKIKELNSRLISNKFDYGFRVVRGFIAPENKIITEDYITLTKNHPTMTSYNPYYIESIVEGCESVTDNLKSIHKKIAEAEDKIPKLVDETLVKIESSQIPQ
jgi:hypothetical protein